MSEGSESLVIYSLLVENKPGVLFRVATQFRRRSFNIESVAVGVTERQDTSRMIITMRGDRQMADDLARVLRRTIDVIEVERLDPGRAVQRELALIKAGRGALELLRGVEGEGEVKPLAEGEGGVVLMAVGEPGYISRVVEALSQGKVLEEVARTGTVALEV